MASGNVTLFLPQMIDVALNFPEHGAVNFNMLHTVLHVLVQQLQLVQCQVEFRGKEGERIQNLMSAKRESTIKLTEYVLSPPKDAGKVVQRKPPKKTADTSETAEGVLDMTQVGSKESFQTVVVVEQSSKPEEMYEPCIISKKCMDDLRNEVGDLKQQVQELAELPGNAALIEAIRGAGIDKASPVLDMFQTMTLSKKMEAAEAGIAKLASIVEDVARQTGLAGFDLTIGESGSSPPGSVGEVLNTLRERLSNIEAFLDSGGAAGISGGGAGVSGTGGAGGFGPGGTAASGGPAGASGIKVPGSEKGESSEQTSGSGGTAGTGASGGKPDKPSKPGSGHGSSGGSGSEGVSGVDVAKEGSGIPRPTPGSQFSVDLNIPDFSTMNQEQFASAVRKEFKKIKLEIKLVYDRLSMLFHLAEEFTPQEILEAVRNIIKKYKAIMTGEGTDTSELPAGERIEQLEDRFNGANEQIASLDSTMNHEINNLHSQFAEMEKAFGNIMEKIHFGFPGGDSPGAGETIGELYEKLMGLQSDMENLAETASKLVEDKEDKQRLMEVLTEQIEFLKTVKADKEDLEDALADKADACAINRKVSHDQFDTACDELSRGIEEALGKLTQQEELWQQALDEIQKEIGNKLDRMELGPLRDFVNNKLKMLQQRLKALTALKKEAEAAGTKKFLRNVNCISCDKDVVMRKEMDPSLLPQPYAMPPSRSMGPYLAYELDALRKQQKSLPNSRNLNHFENAVHQKSPRPGDDHICNRYCGGSHTITTPQQRVTRLGHFLNQWGPEAQGVSEPKEKDDKNIVIVGQATTIQPAEEGLSPRVSKIPSVEVAKEHQQRPSVARSSGSEKRPSKTASGQRVSGAVSPKSSVEAVEKRRSSSATGAQKPSQSSMKRTSQQQEPAPRISQQIPEETPSEVEKENTENLPTGDETDTSSKRVSQSNVETSQEQQESTGEPLPEAPAGGSQRNSQTAQKRPSQMSKGSGQMSTKQSPSKISGQVSTRTSTQLSTGPASARGSEQITAKMSQMSGKLHTEDPAPEE